jgi:transmembrane sensor
MNNKRLELLIDKYFKHTATPDEQQELHNWYRETTGQEDLEPMTMQQEEQAGQEMLAAIQQHIHRKKRTPVGLYVLVATAAAAIAALLIFREPTTKTPAISTKHELVASIPVSATENRFIRLPDSTKVLLHPGSQISFRMEGSTRMVNMQGEAYFDVATHAAQPFVIHTGNITTTILGTSLNIKAWSQDSVTVSVISGKVQVASQDHQQPTILTPNEQLVLHRHNTQQLKVLPSAVIAWAKQDMQFQDMPYEQLAQHLNRRYDVNIQFKNPLLKHCPITGRFTGTETLNEVLDVLSQTMGTTYTIDGRTVMLDGKACFE